MKVYLVLVNNFESDFKGKHYFTYTFIERQTMKIINYTSETKLEYSLGDTLLCKIGTKLKNKEQVLCVEEVIEKYEENK